MQPLFIVYIGARCGDDTDIWLNLHGVAAVGPVYRPEILLACEGVRLNHKKLRQLYRKNGCRFAVWRPHTRECLALMAETSAGRS